MTHSVPYFESSLTPSHMHMPSAKTVIYVPSLTIFSKTKAFCFINQNPLDKLRYSLVFTKSHVLLWVANFWGLTAGFTRLPTLSRTFPIGYLSLLAIPNTRILHFFFLLCDHDILEVVPFYQAHHRTPNTVSIYHVLTTYHRTPNTVLISNHTHVMRYPVHKCNVCAIAYLYHVTNMMNVIWKILSNMHITNASWEITSNMHIISLH